MFFVVTEWEGVVETEHEGHQTLSHNVHSSIVLTYNYIDVTRSNVTHELMTRFVGHVTFINLRVSGVRWRLPFVILLHQTRTKGLASCDCHTIENV